jgi:hypothetical protein
VSLQPKPIQHSRLIAASPVYYGWLVLAAGTLGQLMTTPDQTIGVSVFLDPIIAELGLTLACLGMIQVQGAITLGLGFVAIRGLGQGSLSQDTYRPWHEHR